MQNEIIFSIKLEGVDITSNENFSFTEFEKEDWNNMVNSKLPTKYTLKSINFHIRNGFVYAEGIAEYYSDKLKIHNLD